MLIPPGVSYHQKSALIHAITPYIRDSSARSLLDIGAGSPVTSLAYSAQVATYCAIELAPNAAGDLRRAGLEVLEGSFPDVRPDSTFDLVLASHSMPTGAPGEWRGFLDAAWQLTRPAGGRLLTVTFLGARGDLHELRMATLGRAHDDGEMLSELLADLESRGPTEFRRFNSYVEADSSLGIAQFLRPWLSKEDDESSYVEAPLVAALESRYRVREGLYVLPIEHVSLSCERP